MKTGIENHPVQAEGIIRQRGFTIAATAESFRILSSGIYKYKARAILRELGTNATDSHIAAANLEPDETKKAEILNKPFVVHLPNRFESFFKIRDFGTGLTDKQINTLYIEYFRSDKTKSNDVTGCFGLGSKSPFCYTDNFTVISYVNGRKTKWTSFIAEDGCPDIGFIGAEDTDEPNGLEVSFGVKNEDIEDFRREAASVYKYFKVKPEIVGQSISWPVEEDKSRFTGPDWKAVEGGWHGSSVVIMGNVAYPLEWSSADVSGLVTNLTIQFDIPIGDVDVTVSRESLEYNKRTKFYLQGRAKQIAHEIGEVVAAELAAKTCFWDAVTFHRENSLFLQNHQTWNGRRLDVRQSENTKVGYIQLGRRYGGKIKKSTHDGLHGGYQANYYESYSKTQFLIRDIERGWDGRARGFLKANPDKAYVIILEPFVDDIAADGSKSTNKQVQFFETLGCPDNSILISSLPKPVYVKNTNPRKKSVGIFKYNGSYRQTYAWDEKDDADGGYYVELDGNKPVDMPFYTFQNTVNSLLKLDDTLKDSIFGVRKQAVEKISQDSKWIPLTKALEDARIKKQDELAYAAHMGAWNKALGILNTNTSNDEIKDFKEKVKVYKKKYENVKKLEGLIDYDTRKNYDNEPSKFFDSVKEKYPLLNYWYESSWPSDKGLVNHYVELVETTPQTGDTK